MGGHTSFSVGWEALSCFKRGNDISACSVENICRRVREAGDSSGGSCSHLDESKVAMDEGKRSR